MRNLHEVGECLVSALAGELAEDAIRLVEKDDAHEEPRNRPATCGPCSVPATDAPVVSDRVNQATG